MGSTTYATHATDTMQHLFEVILSNGFSQLRICTAVGIGTLVTSKTWSGSPVLRILHLDMETAHDYKQVHTVCPNLRRFTSFGYSSIHPLKGKGIVYFTRAFCKSLYAIKKSYLINSSIITFSKRLLFDIRT